jgi:outer membrane protein assembly factor BamB
LRLQSGGFEVLLAAMKLRIFLWASAWLAFASPAQDTNVAVRWQFALPDRGAESSPALAPDGTIYEGTFHGRLLALAPDGKLKRQFQAGLEIKSSPAVGADGTIYFGARDRKFYALTPDGRLKWTFAAGAWVDSSPAIAADGTICFGSWDGNFYALNPDGQLKWQFAAGGIVDSSPAIGADGTVYFGSHDKIFYALTPDGRLKWKFTTGAQITESPALAADGTIYFGSTDGNFYALKPDGTERWRQRTGGYTSSSPVLDGQGNLYFAAAKEQCSLDPDGKVRWRFKSYYNNPVSTSAAVLANGQVFTADPWSNSAMANSDGKFLWQAPVAYGNCASANVNPAGDIFVVDGQRLCVLQPLMNAAPPAKSSWPLWRANAQHTGRVEIR